MGTAKYTMSVMGKNANRNVDEEKIIKLSIRNSGVSRPSFSHTLQYGFSTTPIRRPSKRNLTVHATEERLFSRNFILIALVNFATFTAFQMINNGMPVYLAKLGASDLEISLTLTLVTFTALLVRPFAGFILDTFGRKGTLFAGLIITVATTVIYAIFPIVGIILALRVVHGIGWGLSSTSCSTIVADILPKPRFAEGMGWYSLGISLSVAIGPAASLFLIDVVSPEAMIFVSAACLGLSLILSFPVENTFVAESKPKLSDIRLDSLIDRDALMPAAGIFLCNMGFAAVTAFIAVHAMAQGIGNVALYFVCYAVVNLVSRPIVGRIIDKKGFFVPGILGLLGVGLTLAMIGLANNIVLLCAAGVVGGISLGTVMSALQTMAVASVPPSRKGVASSTYLIGLDGGLCVGSLICGAAASALGYSGMFLAVALFPVAACIMFALTFKAWERKTQR